MTSNRKKNQDPSLTIYSLKSLIQEISDWRNLLRTEWPMILLLVAGLSVLLFVTDPFPPRNVYLAVGQPDSSFEKLGKKFQSYFETEGITLHLVNTNGYTESMQEITDPRSPVTAAFALAGIAPKGRYPQLQTLGSIEYVPLWLFHRGEELDAKAIIAALSDKKISIGPKGSGTDILSEKILSLTNLNVKDNPNFLHLNNTEAVQKIIDGEIFAMFIADAENSPNLQKLMNHHELKIFNFDFAQAISKKIPILNPITLPKGSLDLKHRIPAQDINMLATTATLLISKDMHPAIQYLFMTSAEQISRDLEPLFNNPDFFPTYLDRNFPLSPVATRYYEKGAPALDGKLPLWLVSYLDKIWLLLVGAFAVMYPLFKLFPNYRHTRAVILISNAYEEILEIERNAFNNNNHQDLQQMLSRLNDLNLDILNISIPTDDMNRLYSLKSALDSLRKLIANKLVDIEKNGL